MASAWRYRGRVVTTDDVTSIRRLIAENPGASRRRLSEKLCEAWQWKQANGASRDMVCRGLLLVLYRAGEVVLATIASKTRFLILPWVRVPHLASHIRGRMAAVLSDDWQRMYHHPIYVAETFIDPGRFRGTCYRAANWQLLGLTTGRGKNDQTNKPNRPIKEILGLPLTPRFREYLTQL